MAKDYIVGLYYVILVKYLRKRWNMGGRSRQIFCFFYLKLKKEKNRKKKFFTERAVDLGAPNQHKTLFIIPSLKKHS